MIKLNQLNKKVLLIEDNTLTMIILESQFSQYGYNVVKASDGQLGLEAFLQDNFDFVLMDLNIPLISGKQLIQTIRSGQHNSNMPIYAMSAGIDESLGKALLKMGFSGFLNKPVKLVSRAEALFLAGQ